MHDRGETDNLRQNQTDHSFASFPSHLDGSPDSIASKSEEESEEESDEDEDVATQNALTGAYPPFETGSEPVEQAGEKSHPQADESMDVDGVAVRTLTTDEYVVVYRLRGALPLYLNSFSLVQTLQIPESPMDRARFETPSRQMRTSCPLGSISRTLRVYSHCHSPRRHLSSIHRADCSCRKTSSPGRSGAGNLRRRSLGRCESDEGDSRTGAGGRGRSI